MDKFWFSVEILNFYEIISIDIPKEKKAVKIIEVQTGSILKETDIVRFQDIYGRIK